MTKTNFEQPNKFKMKFDKLGNTINIPKFENKIKFSKFEMKIKYP